MTKIFGTEEEEEILKDFATNYEKNMRMEAVNISDEEQVIDTLYKPIKKKMESTNLTEEASEWYPIKDVSDTLNNTYSRDLRGKSVGAILDKLGIDERKKSGNQRLFSVSLNLVFNIAQRLGIDLIGDERDEKDTNGVKTSAVIDSFVNTEGGY